MKSRPDGVFITATGTGVGKTTLATALVRALVARGLRVAGIKPLETGCAPCPLDAVALAEASGQPALADDPAWYRAELPLAPYGVELTAHVPPPALPVIVERAHSIARVHDCVVAEGAGGLLVPIDRRHYVADLVHQLGWPLIMVADDRLGVLSHALTACEAAERRALPVLALVLNQLSQDATDPSLQSNRLILQERLPFPVLSFPRMTAASSAPAALEDAGLVELVMRSLQRAQTQRI